MAMPTELVTEVTALHSPSQPVEWHGNQIVLATSQVIFKMDHLPSSQGCKTSPVSHGSWTLEVRVAMVLVALAGFLILVLLYHVLLLRHKLRTAQARNALEYFGFYHMAHYSLKELNLPPVVTPVATHPPTPPEASSPPSPVVPFPRPPPPDNPLLPPLPLPPPPPPSPPPATSLLPPSHPIIYATPPSPHSDAEVYSHIGALRPSRLSSVSQTQVVLFEHSSL